MPTDTISVFPSSTDRLRNGIPVPPSGGYDAHGTANEWSNLIRSDPGISWPEMMARSLELHGRKTSGESPASVVRAGLSMAGAEAAFTGLVNMRFFDGYGAILDSSAAWTTETGVENFLPAHAIGVFEQTRLERVGTGEAPHGYFGLIHENWGLARYARQLIISEMDLINSPSVDLTMLAADTLGRAAKRLQLDLIYGLLLRNPKMSYDGKAFFSTDHANHAAGPTSVLADMSLDAAMAAVASQSAPDGESEIPVPVGTWGQYLVVAPQLLGLARRLARNMWCKDAYNIVVVPEPRLSLGVIDPASGIIIPGSQTAWMLASPAKIAPSVVVGGLGGPPKPQLRRFDLAGPGQFAGQWGVGFDVVFDVGAVALDPRGLYFSTGA